MADNPADNKGNTSTSALSAGEKALIDRLKTEGDLLRNSGTNSIKSMNLKLEKFDNIFQSISNSLSEQTAILRETFNIQKAENVKKQITDVEKKAKDDSKTAAVSNDDLLKSLDKILKEKLGEDKEKPEGVFSRLGQGAKTAMNNAFWIAMAPALGQIASDLVEEAGKRMNLPQGAIDAFAKTADFATMFGTIGASFGAKWGARGAAMGAGVGAGIAFGDQVLAAAGIDKNQMVTILGQNIPVKSIAEDTFGAIGGAIGLTLSNPSVWKSIFSGTATLTTRLALGATASMAIMSLYLAYGDDVKKWLEKQGMPANFANMVVKTTSFTAAGASLGASFGPEGALVGAAIGFAIGLGESIYDWFIDNKAKAQAEAKKQLADINVLSKDVKTGDDVQNLMDKFNAVRTQRQYNPADLAETEKNVNDALEKLKTENPSLYASMSEKWSGMQTIGETAAEVSANVSTGSSEDKLYKYLINAFSNLDPENKKLVASDQDQLWFYLSQSADATINPAWSSLYSDPDKYNSIIDKAVKDITSGALSTATTSSISSVGPRIATAPTIQSPEVGPRIDRIQSAAKPTALPPLTIVSPTYGGSTVNNYTGGATNSAVNILNGGTNGLPSFGMSWVGH